MKQTIVPVLASCALLLASCGEPAPGADTASRTTPESSSAPAPAAAPVDPDTRPGEARGAREEPVSAREISRSQRKPGPRTELNTETHQDRQLAARVKRNVEPGQSTAPAVVLAHARRAAVSWLRYRVDGVPADTAVVPARLTRTVPPMAGPLRAQGAARTHGVRSYSARPDGKSQWLVFVSTHDARASQIVVKVALASAMARPTTVFVNEGAEL